jgi:GNAT superfamily N-acetyltransferase
MPDKKIDISAFDEPVKINKIDISAFDEPVKKKEPTPLGSSGLDSKSLLPKFNTKGVVTTPMGIVETGLEEPKPINVTLKEKAPEKRYYNQPLEKGLIFTDKTKILEPSSRALTGKIQEVPEIDLTKSTQKDLVEKSREQPFVMPSAEEQKSRKEQGYLLNTVSALDRGFYKNLIGNPVKGLGILLQGATSKVLGGSGKGFVSEALVDFGDYFNKTIDELAPQDEEFKNSLTDQFAQAFGQVGSLVLTAGAAGVGKGASMATQLAPKAAGKAAAARGLVAELTSPTSISAGLSMGQAEFEKAKQYGASDEQAFEVFYKNAAVGSVLEKIPTMQFLKRFNQATSGGIANYIKTKGVAGITGGLEEMTTEVLQQLYSNKTAKDVYNINQNIFEDLTSSGGIGFGVGFLLNAMGAKARLLKRDGKTNEAKQIQDQIQQFESKIEEDNKKEQDEKIKVNNIVDKIEKGELIPLDDIEFYEANKNKIDKAIQAKQLETELSAPSVIMPEENVAPEIIEPTRPAVIMPEENVPVETTVVRPEQQGKAPSVIMPEANVAPEIAETVVTEEEVKPEVKSKLEAFKSKFAPQPKQLSLKGIGAAETRKINEEAKKVEPKDARGFALSWLATGDESVSPDSLNKLLGSFRASLNVGKAKKTQEERLRDYVDKEGEDIDKVADKIWDRLPEQMQDKFTSMDVRDQLEMLIAEYPTRKDAAAALVEYGTGKQGVEEQQARYEEGKGVSETQEEAPIEIKGGFVPIEEDIDAKSLSKNIEDKYNVKLDLFETDKDISLSKIVVPKETRGKGIGTSAMEEIINYADINNKRILLTPSTDFGGTSVDRLKEFYKGFGFVENKGKNKDFTTKETMYRNPIQVEETPFAIEEVTSEEVNQMQDIVKDYINEGITSLPEIKKAIAKELGYNTRKLRQTIDDAYNKYTATKEAAPVEVTSGVVGRIGNALKKMFGKDAQKPFVAKDSKALEAKLSDIKDDVRFQIEAGFRGTNDMPVAYRYDTDQVARERFDIPKLKQIGAGSDRVVFDLGDGKVLKVAKTPRGLEQNIHEGDYYLSGSIIPESFERGLNYVVVEKIDPPLKSTKGFDKLNDLLTRIQKFSQKDFDNHVPELQEVIEEYEMSDIFNYDLLWNDFKAKRNWGLKDGQPLHLDGGSFGGLQMLDKFKGQKPLSDPEFRDIYNKSKKAKIENKDVDKFTKFMAMPDADILGFTYKNKMYLNGEKLNPNTPIHEAGHIWVEWIKTNAPKIYAKGMQLIEGSPYLAKAKESKFYQQQTENMNDAEKAEYFKNEALAMAIGDKGAQFVVESKKESFKDWLKTLWTKIKSLTGFKDLTDQEFQDLTFEEFSKMAVKEILGVENDLDQFQAARSIKKKKEFVKGKIRGEANKRAIDDFEIDDMVKLIKADYDLQTLKNIKDAVQKRSAEEVLPSQPRKIGERRGERRRVEPRIEGQAVAGEGETTQAEDFEEIPEEIENVGLDNQDVDYLGITKKELNQLRESLGLPEYTGTEVETHEMLREIAAKMIKKKASIETLYKKIRNGQPLKNYEVAFMAEYRAALDLELKNNPSKELLEKVREFADNSQTAGSLSGKSLQSFQIVKKINEANTLSNFLLSRQEDKGFTLTDKMISEETSKFEKVQKAKEDLEISIEQDIEKQLSDEAKKEPKKTKEEYAKERKEALAAAREAIKKVNRGEYGLFAVPTFGVPQLYAAAPHINKYARSLFSEGVSKLDDIVTEIQKEFSSVVDGITKRDVIDVIAGKYNSQKRTENAINAGLRLLKREADLLGQLELARKGEEEAKTEKELATKSRRIVELERKIKEVRELNRLKEVAEEGVSENSPSIGKDDSDKTYNEKRQKFIRKKIAKLEDDLKNKNFEKEVVEKPKYKESKKTKELYEKLIDLEKKITLERYKDRQSKLSKWEKGWDKAQSVLGIRRIIQTSIDASIWLRQLSKITFNPLHWDVALKFLNASGKSAFSQKNYDRLMYNLNQAPEYKDSVEDGIRYNDINKENVNELLPKSFIFEIPILKEPLLVSQRLADASLNIARYELYTKLTKNLLSKGITRESDPDEYKEMAKYVMNMTGSGNMLKVLETKYGEKVASSVFYGARLMASNINMLNPAYFLKMPKEVQKMAFRDLAANTSTILALGLAAAAAGAKISFDPDEPDFLQLRFGKKVYDITSGQAAYIRTFLRLVEAGYARAAKSKFEASESASFAWNSTLRFFRNKLAPNNSYVVSAIVGKNSIGEDFDPMEIVKIYPMYADDAYEAAKEDGFISLLTVLLPNIVGLGYSSYYRENALKPMDEIIMRAKNSDEMNPESVKKNITKDEFKQFVKLRDSLIEEKMKELYEEGYNDTPLKELTNEEIAKAILSIKRKATKEAKSELEFDNEDEE